MRTLITLICLLPVTFAVMAVEPVDDQQLMLYYHVPLGAGNQQSAKHQFGLRMDRTTHDPRDTVQIDVLEKQQATIDFRMNYDGVQSIRIHGVNYASYLVARAAASDESEEAITSTESDTATGEDTTEGDPTAATEETAAEEKPAEDEKTIVQQTLDDLPFGVVIGVLLGIGILAGVGG